MFRLLSKQTHIFSIPAYMLVLLAFISVFNIFNFSVLNIVSSLIAFCGIVLGYFLFNNIGLNQKSHLPLFIYTLFIFCFYFGNIDLPLAVTLLGTHLVMLVLTNNNEEIRKNSYFLVGCIIGILYVLQPQIWPILLFVLLHIFGTSSRIIPDLLKIFFGVILIAINYFGYCFIFNTPDCAWRLIPFISDKLITKWDPVAYLAPLLVFLLYSMMDHFMNFAKKSPTSKFKYTLLLMYLGSIVTTLVLYMDTDYEFLLLTALPLAIIISRGIRFMKSPQAREIALWFLILSTLLFKAAYYF